MEEQEQLIRMLHRAELSLSNEPLSAIEIADIIWLATHLRLRQNQTEPATINTKLQQDGESNKTEKTEKKDSSSSSDNQSNNNGNQGKSDSESDSKTDEVSVVTHHESARFKGTKIPFRVPAATAIPHDRKIARALRSLNQKVPSRTVQILDQSKTITQTAEEEFCIPILKAASRRWLDVVLIIETSPSFGIWQQTIKEFKNLLLLQGAFRDVKCWYASADDRGSLDFHSQQGSRRSPRELIVPNGDRLILVLSDCVSSAWYSNAWQDWINFFGKHHPITILQMLPPSFWRRTALGQMDSVWLSSKTPGALNYKWNQESATPWEEETPEGFPVPIVTLDPYALEVWAKGIAGASPTQLAGVYLQILNSTQKNLDRSQTSSSPEQVEQVFKQFMETASPTARRLAALLSAVPVQLPIVRLIQRSLLATNSNAVHVAEIFFSGILRRLNDDPDPEKRLYDFEEGLRAKFNDTLSKQEITGVIDKISAYLARRVGVSIRDFRAMLAVPSEQLESPLASEISEFARISKEVLQGLGKEYADFVSALDKGEIYLPDLGVLVKNFPYEVATIEIKLEFNIVTLVPKEQVKHQLSSTEIDSIERYNSELSRDLSRYQSYQELSDREEEGIDYRIDYHQGISDVAIIAPHGGKIEPGATEITKAIAGDDHAFYSLEGLKEGNNHDLSIPSEKFDEPRALEIVGQANRVIVIHGFFGNETDVYLGGLDADLRQKIKENLGSEGFSPRELESSFQGANPNNICNRGQTGKGVQIGIPWGLRKQLFDSLKSESNEPILFERFIQAIRDALSPLEAAGLRSQITQGEADYYTEELANNRSLYMIRIPGGSFMMGSPVEETDSYKDERPQHQVTVPTFFMGLYPITQEQWRIVAEWEPVEIELNTDPSHFKEAFQEKSELRGRWERPVENISWEEAKEFCARLAKKTGKEYRLPTEAEWEYACRAGTTTPFHFGETITTDLANYNGSIYGEGVKGEYREQTTPVGYFKVANAFGLCDMHGNVLEWCEDDWHENYENAPTDGSAWFSESSSNKVLRGGSWLDIPFDSRSAFRVLDPRDFRFSTFGLRVVCVAPRTT